MNEKCFGLAKRNECSILTEKKCAGYEQCPFYKPKRKAEQDQAKANVRLRKLPVEKQRGIADRYYDGRMPWMGEIV